MEFTADGNLIGISGELRTVAKVSIEKDGEGFIVSVENLIDYTDKPNCQGKSLDFVKANAVQRMYVKSDGAVLRMYFGATADRPFLEYVRPTPGGI